MFVEDIPIELALAFVREPERSATGTITELTRFETREACERHKAERERAGEDELRKARDVEIELLGKEVDSADREAREACAAHRTDDCEVAKETARAFRDRVASARARTISHVELGTCRDGRI